MKTVEKKIYPQYFQAILDGRKTWELRLDDFDIEEDDEFLFREWDPERKDYTGRIITKKVGCIGKVNPEELTHWSQDEIKSKGLQIISLL